MRFQKFIPFNIWGEATESRYTYLLRDYDGTIVIGTISNKRKKIIIKSMKIRELYKEDI